METFVLLRLKDPAGSNLTLSPTTTGYFHLLTLQNLKKMKNKLIIFGLLFLPMFMHAQNQEKCADLVVIPQTLYDSFQTQKANLNEADREIKMEHAILDDLLKRFLGCETQPDVAAMIKRAEEALNAAEANRKISAGAFDRVDGEVREIIRTAHGRPVGYRYLEPGYGELGRVVTMNFNILDGKVTTMPTYYQLPDMAAH
jgi:hypothetical protein